MFSGVQRARPLHEGSTHVTSPLMPPPWGQNCAEDQASRCRLWQSPSPGGPAWPEGPRVTFHRAPNTGTALTGRPGAEAIAPAQLGEAMEEETGESRPRPGFPRSQGGQPAGCLLICQLVSTPALAPLLGHHARLCRTLRPALSPEHSPPPRPTPGLPAEPEEVSGM